MQIIVRASAEQKEEWQSKPAATKVGVKFISAEEDIFSMQNADVYFDLLFEKSSAARTNNDKLIFVHAINELLHELPANCVRINAWNGFLKRDVIEIVASEKNKVVAS